MKSDDSSVAPAAGEIALFPLEEIQSNEDGKSSEEEG